MTVTVSYAWRGRDVQEALDVDALAEHVLNAQDIPENYDVSITFVTNDAIQQMNRDYRDLDKPTDVLSFECDGVDDGFDDYLPENTEESFELGDILIAVDIAEQQSQEFGLTFGEELSLLVTHGLLHLCGMDHLEEDEAELMEAREKELLTAFWGKEFDRHGVNG